MYNSQALITTHADIVSEKIDTLVDHIKFENSSIAGVSEVDTKTTKAILLAIPDVAAVFNENLKSTSAISKRTNKILANMSYKGSKFYQSLILRVNGRNRYKAVSSVVCITAFRDHLLNNKGKYDVVDFKTFTVLIENRPDQILAEKMLSIFDSMCDVNGTGIPDELKGAFSPTLEVVLYPDGVISYLALAARKIK